MSGLRACLAVKKNKSGFCQCARYGTPDMAKKSFLELCREAGFPVKVGKVIPKGGNKAMKRRSLGDFDGDFKEFSEFEEYEDVPVLDSISDALEEIDWDFVKEFGGVGLGSALAGIGYQILDNKLISQKIENDYLRAGIKAGVGLIGAYIFRRKSPAIAYGVAGALVGGAMMDLANKFFPATTPATAPNTTATPGTKGIFDGFGNDIPSEEELYNLRGDDTTDEKEENSIVPVEGVEEEKLLTGVEEEKLLSANVEEESLFGDTDEESALPLVL